MMFEDFVPVSDTHALVSIGPKIAALTRIETIEYAIDTQGVVQLGPRTGAVEAQGTHLRLGGKFDGVLVYSDGFTVKGVPAPSDTAHQPYLYQGDLYYTDEWPFVRIHKNGDRYLDLFGDMAQVGNPHWYEGVMYFEARSDPSPSATDKWEVWSHRPGDEAPTFICKGANPAAWGGWLYYGVWNGRAFEYHRRAIG